jgi:hypothetical protein
MKAASCLLVACTGAAAAAMQSGEPSPYGTPRYRVISHTVDAGGGESGNDGWRVAGTIGQPDADPLLPARGGRFRLDAGFWTFAPGRGTSLFADGFESP